MFKIYTLFNDATQKGKLKSTGKYDKIITITKH